MNHIIIALSSFLLICALACSSNSTENSNTSLAKKDDKKELASTSDKKDSAPSSNANGGMKIKYPLPDWPIKAKVDGYKQYPFDEGQKDEKFASFRQQLYSAIKNKDTRFLKAAMKDSIFWSFGGEYGKDSFFEYAELNTDPENSFVWDEMAKCLELGGAFNEYDEKLHFSAPYIFMLEVFEDAFGEGIVIGEKVRLRDAPGLKSNIIGSLSWDHVLIAESKSLKTDTIDGEVFSWLPVEVLTNQKENPKGYVFGKYVRISVDYRIGFVREDTGDWKIEYFVAGD